MATDAPPADQQRTDVAGTVYYAISDGYDDPPKLKSEHGVLRELRTTSKKGREATLWNREQKILHPPSAGLWSLYLDGSLTPKVPIRPLVEDWLANHEMALFKHPNRKCAYVEVDACVARKKISKREGDKAKAHLSLAGLPQNAGLYACTLIARRTSGILSAVLPAPWFALVQQVPRDQIWLPLILHQMPGSAKRIRVIDADIFDNPWFSFKRHNR